MVNSRVRNDYESGCLIMKIALIHPMQLGNVINTLPFGGITIKCFAICF